MAGVVPHIVRRITHSLQPQRFLILAAQRYYGDKHVGGQVAAQLALEQVREMKGI